MAVRIIAAMTSNRVIGKDGKIPWESRDDMAHFRTLTQGSGGEWSHPNEWNVCIMGRKTFESVPGPLEFRHTVVITSENFPSIPFGKASPTSPVHFAITPEEALRKAKAVSSGDVWICGGENIYTQFLHDLKLRKFVNTIKLTEIPTSLIEGNTFFPRIDDHWELLNTNVKKGLLFHTYGKRS